MSRRDTHLLFHKRAAKVLVDTARRRDDEHMRFLRADLSRYRFVWESGASVLAALVIVAVLGMLFVGLEYARSTGLLAYEPDSMVAAVADGDNGITDTCANGTVHTIDESTGAVPAPQESPPGGAKCWVPDPNAGTAKANPKDVGTMMPGPDAASAACRLSQPDKCVVQYCLPSTMLNQSFSPSEQGSVPGCIVVNCGSVGGTQCLQSTLSTLANTTQGPAAVVGASLIADKQTALIGGTTNETQFLTQALSPQGAQSVSNYVAQVNGQVPGGDAQLSTLSSAIQQGNAPCDTGAADCTPTNIVAANPPSVASNPDLSNTANLEPGEAQSLATPQCGSGQCTAMASSQDQINTLQSQGYTCDTTGAAGGLTSCSKTDTASAGNPTCTGAYCNGGGSGTTFQGAVQAPCPAGQSGTPCTTTGGAAAGCTPSLLNLWNCGTSTGSGNSTLGTYESLGVSFLTGLIKGIAPSLTSGVSNGVATLGNTVAQTAGTCTTQYVCGNSALYYQQNTCVQSLVQTCQYGCNGNSCAASTQSTAPYGYGTDGSTCSQPPTEPSASYCSTGSWQAVSANNNGCVTGWQCPAAATSTAQVSCGPSTVDVGGTVSISYACGNATAAIGSGFTTNGLTGTATALMSTPPEGATVATYTLACENSSGQVTGAQCSVNINQPVIALVADPATTTPGTASLIGWVTTGMQSCVISSPQDTAFTTANAQYTSISGVATTSALASSTTYLLTCHTLGGNVATTSTTVTVSQ